MRIGWWGATSLLLFLGTFGCEGSSGGPTAPGVVSLRYPDSRVFVLDLTTAEIRVLDANARAAPPVSAPLDQVEGPAGGVALDPSANRLWISERSLAQVAVLDPATMTRLATIPVGSLPGAIAMDGANGRVFVANEGDGTVSVLDAGPPFAEFGDSPVAVGASPCDVVVEAGTVTVANRDADTLSVFAAVPPFDAVAGSPFPVGAAPVDLAVDPAEDLVFVVSRAGDSLSVLSLGSLTVTTPWTDLDGPVQVARHPDRDLLFVAQDGDALRVFSSAAVPVEQPDSPVALGAGQGGVSANGFLDRVFVSVPATGEVRVLEGEAPFAAATDPALVGPEPGTGFAIEPVLLQTLRSPQGGNVEATRVAGDRLYLAHGTLGLVILDNRDPRAGYADRFLGSVTVPGSAVDVEIDGFWAFISNGGEGIQVVDVADPGNTVIERTVTGLGTTDELARDGDFLLVDVGAGGVRVLDIRRPRETERVASRATGGSGVGFDYDEEDRLVYFASGIPDVRLVDVANPFAPAHVETIPVPVDANDVAALANDTAAVATGLGGLRLLWVRPFGRTGSSVEGNLALDAPAMRVEGEGPLAFVTDAANNLVVVDASDRGAPRRLGLLDPAGTPRHFLREKSKLYVSQSAAGVEIYRFYP
ncbi:MAG: hypothetical protein ACYTEZ_03745 [Planctomycetota bacterium]|jgi:DNA-binding beta-propeller fold protein YncE